MIQLCVLSSSFRLEMKRCENFMITVICIIVVYRVKMCNNQLDNWRNLNEQNMLVGPLNYVAYYEQWTNRVCRHTTHKAAEQRVVVLQVSFSLHIWQAISKLDRHTDLSQHHALSLNFKQTRVTIYYQFIPGHSHENQNTTTLHVFHPRFMLRLRACVWGTLLTFWCWTVFTLKAL